MANYILRLTTFLYWGLSTSFIFIFIFYLRAKFRYSNRSHKEEDINTISTNNININGDGQFSEVIVENEVNMDPNPNRELPLPQTPTPPPRPRRFSFGRKSSSPVAIPAGTEPKSVSSSSLSSLSSSPGQKRYAQIPLVVKPLTPPRSVVMLEDIGTLLTEDVRHDVLMTKIRLTQSSLRTADKSTLNCKLVIGIHATLDCLAGYCVNMEDKSCHIYTYDWEEIPWILNDDLNPTENKSDLVQLAVTNLIFALLLWDKQIIKAKKVRFYIGDEISSNSSDCRKYLKHYSYCRKVEWINENDMCVNVWHDPNLSNKRKFEDFDYFAPISERDLQDLFGLKEKEFQKMAQFIQPVMDLTHGKHKAAEAHIRHFFGLDDDMVFKTHCQKKWNKSERRYFIETTGAYDTFLEQVKFSMQQWHTPCRTCSIRAPLNYRKRLE